MVISRLKVFPAKEFRPFENLARAAVYNAKVPPNEEPGLEGTFYYKTPNPVSNATHIALVESDPVTGFVKLLKYAVVEKTAAG